MPEFVPLPRTFYAPSADIVAPRLLGHYLIRNTPDGPLAGAIIETEAYLSNDPACHAANGRTPRNRVMWGEHGRAYVYLIYGMHFCFNAVCQPAGVAEAVLVRALEPVLGEELMQAKRPVGQRHELTSGPAKLCAALSIDREHDGLDLCDPGSPLFIARNPNATRFRRERAPLVTATRIGISRAAELPLRFYLDGSLFVSRRAVNGAVRARLGLARRKTV